MDDLHFSPLRADHLPMLAKWLERPHIARWFAPAEDWIAEARMHVGNPTWLRHFLAFEANTPFAFIQRYDTAQAPQGVWSAAPAGSHGMDLFVAEPSMLRRGYGRELVEAFANLTFATTSATGIVVDPVAENEGARSFFLRCGFSSLADSGLLWRPR